MSNLSHIVKGWGKSMGFLSIDDETALLSKERLSKCAVCPFAKESKILKLLRGVSNELAAIHCKKCGCPVNEKSLVQSEKCPEGKW